MKNLLVQYFPSCAKTICMENRFDLLVLLMLQKEGKTYLGILVGLQRDSSSLLWCLHHLQSWQHLQKQASASVPMVGQTAGVTFSGGTNPGPFFHSWSAQGCRHMSGRNIGMGRERTNVFPSISAPAWLYTLNMQPEESWGNQRDNSPSHFRPPWHTPTPIVLQDLGFELKYWHKPLKNFRASRSNFHGKRKKLRVTTTLHRIV